MPERSDKYELKGGKDNFKRKSSGSRNEHIEQMLKSSMAVMAPMAMARLGEIHFPKR